MTRSGDFSPKKATNFGYFPANVQKFWAIFRQIAEMWAIPLQNSDFGPFWNFLATFGNVIWSLCLGSSGVATMTMEASDGTDIGIPRGKSYWYHAVPQIPAVNPL